MESRVEEELERKGYMKNTGKWKAEWKKKK